MMFRIQGYPLLINDFKMALFRRRNYVSWPDLVFGRAFRRPEGTPSEESDLGGECQIF